MVCKTKQNKKSQGVLAGEAERGLKSLMCHQEGSVVENAPRGGVRHMAKREARVCTCLGALQCPVSRGHRLPLARGAAQTRPAGLLWQRRFSRRGALDMRPGGESLPASCLRRARVRGAALGAGG